MAFIYDLSDTWNAGATTFTAIKMNVTDTASAAGSKLIDLQVGGTTRFDVDKNGQVEISAGTALLPSLSTLGDTNTGMWFPAADTIAFSEGGAEVMRIDSSGRVGIGTSAATTLLSVNGIASFGAGAVATPSIAAFGDLNTGMWFPAADTIAWSTAGSERLRISSGGNVGIGVGGTPTQLFEVIGGNIRLARTSGNPAYIIESTQASGYAPTIAAYRRTGAGSTATPNASIVGEIRFDGLDANNAYAGFATIVAQIGTNAAGGAPTNIIFQTAPSGAGPTERIRIDSSGNVGIGTTSFGTSAAKVLGLGNATAPSTGPADTIQIYSTDLSAGNTMLSLYTEGTVVNTNIVAATTHRIAIRVNGTVYYLLANTSA
jgi:hypothetical protein